MRESVGEGGRERENMMGEELLLPAWTGSRQGKQPPQGAANSARVAFCSRWPRICCGSVRHPLEGSPSHTVKRQWAGGEG